MVDNDASCASPLMLSSCVLKMELIISQIWWFHPRVADDAVWGSLSRSTAPHEQFSTLHSQANVGKNVIRLQPGYPGFLLRSEDAHISPSHCVCIKVLLVRLAVTSCFPLLSSSEDYKGSRSALVSSLLKRKLTGCAVRGCCIKTA